MMPSYMYKHPPLSPDLRQADRSSEASISPHRLYPSLISPTTPSPDVPKSNNCPKRPASPVGTSIGGAVSSFLPVKRQYPCEPVARLPPPPPAMFSHTPPSSPEKDAVQHVSPTYYGTTTDVPMLHTPPTSPKKSPPCDDGPQDFSMRRADTEQHTDYVSSTVEERDDEPRDYSMRDTREDKQEEKPLHTSLLSTQPRSPTYASIACSSNSTASSTLPVASASTSPRVLPLTLPPALPTIGPNPMLFPPQNHMQHIHPHHQPRPSSVCSSNEDNVSVVSTTSSSEKPSRKPKDQTFQDGVTVGYTYDAFFITDGRSRRRNPNIMPEKVRQRYSCSECGKNYATSSNLSRHKQTHRSLDSQLAKKCPHCTKVYVSMPALSMHILTHNLNHRCPVCNKSFSRPWLLQGHMRSHTGQKPYGCAHCGKAFADRSNLRAHMQTHSTFKHYTCERCEKSFALKSYLNKHYESACFKDCAEIPEIHSPPVSPEHIDVTS